MRWMPRLPFLFPTTRRESYVQTLPVGKNKRDDFSILFKEIRNTVEEIHRAHLLMLITAICNNLR